MNTHVPLELEAVIGDDSTTYTYRLKDRGGYVDLDGATGIAFIATLRAPGGETDSFTASATADADQVVNKGQLSVELSVSDLSSANRTPGVFEVETQVTWVDRVATFPSGEPLDRLTIRRQRG